MQKGKRSSSQPYACHGTIFDRGYILSSVPSLIQAKVKWFVDLDCWCFKHVDNSYVITATIDSSFDFDNMNRSLFVCFFVLNISRVYMSQW